jgi:hypothetical protein
MKIYYVRKGDENLGPFSLDELRRYNLKATDFVWKEGEKEWLQAKFFQELQNLFTGIGTPPPFADSLNSKQNQNSHTAEFYSSPLEKKPNSFWFHFRWIVAIVLITCITASFLIHNNSSDNQQSSIYTLGIQKTPEQLREELATEEKGNPLKYLKLDGTMRSNLIGQKVIEGNVKNTASVATYKDVVIAVGFLSVTKDVISTQHFRLNEFLPSNGSKNFKFKTFAPAGTDSFTLTVAEALPID